jgi:hypothetical protein
VSSYAYQEGVSPDKKYTGSADVHLSQAAPLTNFAKSERLQLSGLPGNEQVVLMRWDLTKIPVGKKVLSTAFEINVTGASGQTYQVYQALRNWDPDQATWNLAANGSRWEVPGAKGASDRAANMLGTLAPSADGSYKINLNNDGIRVVQNWIKKSAPNYGFILVATPGTGNLAFESDESINLTNRPKLSILITGN